MHEKSKIRTELLFKILLFVVVALVLGVCIFAWFRLKINANEALRNAKNVRLSLRSADIEMYAMGKSVYNPANIDGVETGAAERAAKIYIPDGQYAITAYDYANHEITGMTYREGRYVVTFSKYNENVRWQVDYNLNVYTFDEVE